MAQPSEPLALFFWSGLIIFWLTPISAWWVLANQRNINARFWFLGTAFYALAATLFMFAQAHLVGLASPLINVLTTASLLSMIESSRRELRESPAPLKIYLAVLASEWLILYAASAQGFAHPEVQQLHFMALVVLELILISNIWRIKNQTNSKALLLILFVLLFFVSSNLYRLFDFWLNGHWHRLMDFSSVSNAILLLNYVSVVFYCYGYWGFVVEKNQRLLLQNSAKLLAAKESETAAVMNRLNQAGALSASIAHEINQPIASIQLNIEEALRIHAESANNSNLSVILQRIARDNQTCSEIIQRIKRVFQRPPTFGESTEPDVLIEHFIRHHQSELTQALVLFKLNLKSGAKLNFPPDEFMHVIRILFRNSMEALDQVSPSSRRLEISTWRVEDMMFIEITDSGCGVSEEMRHKLFTPVVSNKSGGMGIGLWLSKYMIERHGGDIRWLPVDGQGSRFLLQFNTVEDVYAKPRAH